LTGKRGIQKDGCLGNSQAQTWEGENWRDYNMIPEGGRKGERSRTSPREANSSLKDWGGGR